MERGGSEVTSDGRESGAIRASAGSAEMDLIVHSNGPTTLSACVPKAAIAQGLVRAVTRLQQSNITCEELDGILVLRGLVPTYFHKQLAQQALLANPSLGDVRNEIDVVLSGQSARM
jgi:hypothetical protein